MPFLCIYLVMELLALVTICPKKKRSISSSMEALNCSAFKHCKWSLEPPPMQSITKNHPLHGFPRSLNYSWKPLSLSLCGIRGSCVLKKGLHVVSPDLASPGTTAEHLRAREDAYQGVVIDPESLPLSANAFASALRASLGTWKLKGKRGVWLKILQEQAELVPIAIQEGFSYHHAEPGYVVLTYWIPSEPCTLPASPSQQIGIAGFVINDRGEILVVKEQCSCSCSGVWKLPTGYINKSEDIFSGAVREVKEETGVDTTFLEMVAFRHAHLVAFEKSDLMFVCLLKPLSFDITIDEKEIQAAKWMPVDEVLEQPFYREDQMSRRIIEVCKATYEEHYYCGFTAHQLISLFDGNLASCLYYSDKNLPCFLPSN